MDNSNKRKTNILYAVIGVLTLMITVMGATFAYYTATRTVNNVIKGNMATITFSLAVEKKLTADDSNANSKGLIPMTNSMVEKAVNTTARGGTNSNGICVDDNGNVVCQIYKITAVNTGTASMFVDGYVTLTGGSGSTTVGLPTGASTNTTMRWAQVFCREDSTSHALTFCTTASNSTVVRPYSTSNLGPAFTALGSGTGSQFDTAEILTSYSGVTGNATIYGNTYSVIDTNYIRISGHSGAGYTQSSDVPSALVYNQFLEPNDGNATNNTGHSFSGTSGTTPANYADAQVYYIVIWLAETGQNQTAGSGGNAASSPNRFYEGSVTFVTSQGSEITSKFNGYTAVTPDTVS